MMATTSEVHIPTELRATSRVRVCKWCRFSTSDAKDFLHHQMYAHDNMDVLQIQMDDLSDSDIDNMIESQNTSIDGNLNNGESADGNNGTSSNKVNGTADSENDNDDLDADDNCIFHRKYSCALCDLTTTNAKSYLNHLNDKHDHSIVIYECKKCTYATKYKQKLRRHEAAHTRRESGESRAVTSEHNEKEERGTSGEEKVSVEQHPVQDDEAVSNKDEEEVEEDEHQLETNDDDVDFDNENESLESIRKRESERKDDASDEPLSPVEEVPSPTEAKKNVEGDEWAENNRMDDEDFRKVINVPSHTIPPLDESDSEDEGALVIAEEESSRKTQLPSNIPAENDYISHSSAKSPHTFTLTPESGDMLIKKKRPPRQEIDPNKYKEVLDEEGKTKFACTACGSAYTWKKSLSKHWKEKHDDSKGGSSSASSPVLPHPVKTAPTPLSAQLLTPQLSARLNHDRVMKGVQPPLPFSPLNVPAYIRPKPLFTQGRGLWMPGAFGQDLKNDQVYKEPSRKEGDVYGNPFAEVLRQKSKAALVGVMSLEMPMDLSVKKEAEDPYFNRSVNSEAPDSPLDFSVMRNQKDGTKFDSDGFLESSATLQCSKCGQVTTTIEEFNKHMEIHLTKRGHNCAECRTKFKTSEDLNRHFSEVHREKILDTAQIAFSMDRYAQHSKLEFSQSEGCLNCPHCEFVAKWPTELQKHIMVHSTERPYVCMVCNADYKWKWDLVKHFDKTHHSLPNPYRKREYSPHMKSFGSSESPEPPRKRKPTEVKHAVQDDHPPFMCSVCGFHCKVQVEMMIHMRDVHQSEGTDPTDDDSDSDKFSLSSTAFEIKRTTSELRVDIPRQGLHDSDEELEMELAAMEVPLSSPGTHASVSVRQSLKEHLAHLKQQPKLPKAQPGDRLSSADILLPYKCSLCEYRARWPSEITQHMKNHSDEKPYLCPRCSYRSKWKWDVVKHLKRCGGGTIKDVIDTTKNKPPKYHRSTLPKTVPPGQPYISIPPDYMAPGSIPSAHTKQTSSLTETAKTTVGSSLHPMMSPKIPAAHMPKAAATPSTTVAPPAHTTPVDTSHALFPLSLGLIPVSKSPPTPTATASQNPQSPEDYMRVNPILTSGGNIVKAEDSSSEPETMYGQPAVATSALLSKLDNSNRHSVVKPVTSLINDGLHHCLNCAFVASSPAELKRHRILHSEEKPFRCDSCEYQTKWKCDLKKHVQAYGHVTSTKFVARSKTARTESPFKSTQSMYPRGTESPVVRQELNAVVENDPKGVLLKCESCDYTTLKRHLLESHQKIHEKPGQMQSNKYKCKQCHFQANDLPSFLQHKVEHSNQHAHRANAVSPASAADEDLRHADNCHSPKHGKHSRKPTKKLYCSSCPFACIDADRMEYHNDRHSQVAAFTCAFCSYSVDEKEELDIHMRIHPEYTRTHAPFIPSPQNLMVHDSPSSILSDGYQTTRKGNRKLYQCKKCPYSNESHGNITRHVEKHGKHSKYKCPKCDYSLDRLNLLLQHTRGVHGIHDADKVWLNYSNFMQSVAQLKDRKHKIPDGVGRSPQLEVQKEYQISSNPKSLPVRGGSMQVVFRGVKHRLYKCPKCPFKSKRESSCLTHIKMHGMNGAFMCSHCDYSANKMERVKRHMEMIHGDADALVLINKPQVTTQSFDESPDGKTHGSNESAPELTPRPQIVELTSNPDLTPPDLDSDDGNYDEEMPTQSVPMYSQSPSKPKFGSLSSSPKLRTCHLCPYAVKGRLPFERHMECHKKEGRYTCKHCNYSLDRLNLLYQHMQLHGDMSRDIPSKNKSAMRDFSRRKIMKEQARLRHQQNVKVPFLPNEDLACLMPDDWEHDDSAGAVDDVSFKMSYESPSNSMTVFPERELSAQEMRDECSKDSVDSDGHQGLKRKLPEAEHSNIATEEDDDEDDDVGSHIEGTSDLYQESDALSCPECPFIAETDEECEKHYSFHVNKYKYRCDYCTFSHDRLNILYQHRKLHSDTPGFVKNPAPSTLEHKTDGAEMFMDSNSESFEMTNGNESDGVVGPSPSKKMKHDDKIDENASETNQSKTSLVIKEPELEKKEATGLLEKSFQEIQKNQRLEQNDGGNGDGEDEKEGMNVEEGSPVTPRQRSRSGLREKTEETKLKPMLGAELSVHSSGTIYGCDECPYYSNNKANYLNHSERHKKKSKFQCPYCTYSTGRQNQCLNHTRLHFATDSEFDVDMVTEKILEARSALTAVQDMSDIRRTRTKSASER